MSGYGLQIQRTLDQVREQMRLAQRAATDATRERSRLKINPDGTRGSLSVADYEKQVAETGKAKIDAAQKIGMDHFAKARDELRDLKRRAQTFASDDAANHAYLTRVKPLLDGGTTIQQAITFFVNGDDPDALAGLHRHAAAYLASKAGGNPNDRQTTMGIAEAVAAIEAAQEQAGFIDSELREYRAIDRQARGLAEEFDAIIGLSLKEAAGSATATDTLSAGYAVNDAKRIASGEQPTHRQSATGTRNRQPASESGQASS